MDFPANSKKAEEQTKRVEQITSAKVDRRKKSLTKQFSEVMIGGTPKDAFQAAIFNVLVPAAKDAIIDAVQSGFETLIRGEVRVKHRTPTASAGTPQYAYNRIAQSSVKPPTALSRAARARHDFDELVLQSRAEADEVIEQLATIVEQYDSASVADLYTLTGFKSDHTDNKWGWTNLASARVSRDTGGGYLLHLPKPIPI